MFKDDPNKDSKARNIAEWLSKTNLHKTHGRPISMKEAREKGLIVKALEDDNEFQDKVLSVFHAAMVTHLVSNCVKFVENQNGQGAFLNVEVQIPQKK